MLIVHVRSIPFEIANTQLIFKETGTCSSITYDACFSVSALSSCKLNGNDKLHLSDYKTLAPPFITSPFANAIIYFAHCVAFDNLLFKMLLDQLQLNATCYMSHS